MAWLDLPVHKLGAARPAREHGGLCTYQCQAPPLTYGQYIGDWVGIIHFQLMNAPWVGVPHVLIPYQSLVRTVGYTGDSANSKFQDAKAPILGGI